MPNQPDLRARLVTALDHSIEKWSTGRSEDIADVLLSLPGIAITADPVWYMTTDAFKRGGKVIAGPFPTIEDALRMSERIGRHSGTLTYWVDKKPWAAAAEADHA